MRILERKIRVIVTVKSDIEESGHKLMLKELKRNITND